MAEKNSFWKKYEFIIIAVLTLLLIYGIIFFNQKINYFLGNDLILYVTPIQESFHLHYGGTAKAEFGVSIDNVAYCKTSCSYSFNDRSGNELVDKGSFYINAGEHFIKSYELGVKRHGSGEYVYSFDVSCHNIHSFVCLTESPEKYRSSLITVSYDLTDKEKDIKKTLKQNLTQLLGGLAGTGTLQGKADQKYSVLSGIISLKNLSEEKIMIDDEYDKTRISIENLRSLWNAEDYAKLSQAFNQDFLDAFDKINNMILNFDNDINAIVQIHNNLLSQLDSMSNNLNQLSIILAASGSNETQNKLDAAILEFNDISSSIVDNNLNSYDNASIQITNAASRQYLIINESKNSAAIFFFNTAFSLKRENDLLCSLKQNCNENISIAGTIKDTQNFIKDYPDASNLMQACSSLALLNRSYSGARSEALSIIAGKNISFPADNNFSGIAEQFKANVISMINNSYYASFQDIKNTTNPDVAGIAESVLPKGSVSTAALSYNQSINISLYLLSTISIDDLPQLTGCSKLNEAAKKITHYDFSPVNSSIAYTNITGIDTYLSNNPPICCVFNECKPCCVNDSCRNDPETFPVIFVHGHSFAEDNSPEYSLEAFNRLQSKMQEDGYLNAGIVSLYSRNEPLQEGIWEFSGQPVTVKISYYYDAFRKDNKYIVIPTKSENIDTYALRLRDMINIIKERTNKPKVDIVAHSMGGLVARRYIQIFGAQDIDKFIMIATPNQGLSGKSASYCSYVGGSRECADMLEDSLFMNKLNDPLNQPANARLYIVEGRGCDTNGKDGDGVVPLESAKLENAETFYVNGTCAGFFGATLHTYILNIIKYPETYNIIKEILNK